MEWHQWREHCSHWWRMLSLYISDSHHSLPIWLCLQAYRQRGAPVLSYKSHHIGYIGKVIEKIKVFVISCTLHWMAVCTRLSRRISYNFVHPLLYCLTYEIKKYEVGVTSNSKTFMPYYVQIGYLVQKLTEETYTYRTRGDPVRPLFPL